MFGYCLQKMLSKDMGWQELGNVSKFVHKAKNTKNVLQNIIDKQGFRF